MDRLGAVAAALTDAIENRIGQFSVPDAAHLTALTNRLRSRYLDARPTAKLPEQPFKVLTDLFDLDGANCSILVVAAAGELDPVFGVAFGLTEGLGSRRPSVALTMELCGLGTFDPASRARFMPNGPLRQHNLVELVGDGTLMTQHLRISDRVVAHLLGDPAMDQHCERMQRPPVPVDLPGAAELAAMVESGARLIYIQEPYGTSGLSLAAECFHRLGVTCLAFDLSRRGGCSVGDALMMMRREAGFAGAGLIVAGIDAIPEDDAFARWLELSTAPVPVIAIGKRTWQSQWMQTLPPVVAATRITTQQRKAIWEKALGDTSAHLLAASSPASDDLLSLNITPEDIDTVVLAARRDVGSADTPITVADLRRATRRLGGSSLEAGMTRAQPTAQFEDLILPEVTLDAMRELVGWARHRDDVLSRGPVTGKGEKGRGIVAMFGGSPGTGKSLAASVLASTLGLDLLTVELSALIDKYIGETQKNLEKVFHQAENMNCVLFFDEADALFGARSEINDSKDRYANQEVAYLLQRLETFDGIAILATNLRGNIDSAFARRLHFIIAFPDPDPATRVRLWQSHLEAVPIQDPHDPIDVRMLGNNFELNGGEIRNVVMAAAYSAAIRDEPMGADHIRRAVHREYGKLARMLPSTWPQRPDPAAEDAQPRIVDVTGSDVPTFSVDATLPEQGTDIDQSAPRDQPTQPLPPTYAARSRRTTITYGAPRTGPRS